MDKQKLLAMLASQAPTLLKSLSYGSPSNLDMLKPDLSNANEIPGVDLFVNNQYDLGLMDENVAQYMEDPQNEFPEDAAYYLTESPRIWTTEDLLANDVPITDPLMLQILKKYKK